MNVLLAVALVAAYVAACFGGYAVGVAHGEERELRRQEQRARVARRERDSRVIPLRKEG